MHSKLRGRRWALLLLALAMLAGACSGDDSGGAADEETAAEEAEDTEAATDESASEDDTAAAEGSGGTFSTYIGEPESLVPTNTNETNGAEPLNALFSGLVEYDPETSEPLLGEEGPRAMAESIESEDQTTWTITLKEGWTFHDGTPVTAQSFVDSWNYGALQTNAQGNAYFFANIEGYEDLQCPEDQVDEEGACNPDASPAAEEMSGLSAPDDTTIEVTLTAPFSQFPLTVGYTAFYPMAEACLADQDACNEEPIGNGPFQMDGAWAHDQGINVVRYEEYGGEPAVADGVEFRIYAEPDTAYNDLLSGGLDILEDVPAAQIPAAQTEFGDAFLEGESSSFTYLGFPTYDERFANADLRMAMSMAIDRQAITDAIRVDAVPADAFVSPVVAGYREGACGQACEYDPEAARELFDSAGGFEGELVLWLNTGGDHEAWMEAVANQLRENLGIEQITFQSLDFAEYLGLADNEEFTGPFRLGWVMDYPSPQNYLEPIHATDGSSNNTGFSNEEFDALIAEGNSADSVDAGIESYNAAEDILAEEVPLIPMFFGRTAGAYSENVEGVVLDAFTRLNIADISVVAP